MVATKLGTMTLRPDIAFAIVHDSTALVSDLLAHMCSAVRIVFPGKHITPMLWFS
jgi:hypothetical protein